MMTAWVILIREKMRLEQYISDNGDGPTVVQGVTVKQALEDVKLALRQLEDIEHDR